MLQISYIRENKEKVIVALAKKNIDGRTLVEEVILLDENRRSTQVALDNTLAEANKLSTAIGDLMKNGEKAKAEILKLKTVHLMQNSKLRHLRLGRVLLFTLTTPSPINFYWLCAARTSTTQKVW